MKKYQNHFLAAAMAALLLLSAVYVGRETAFYASGDRVNVIDEDRDRPCVVIDAGHGGGILRRGFRRHP